MSSCHAQGNPAGIDDDDDEIFETVAALMPALLFHVTLETCSSLARLTCSENFEMASSIAWNHAT